MWDARSIYFRDVLGIDLSLRPAAEPARDLESTESASSQAPIAVCVPPSSSAEQALIEKILQSIQLRNVVTHQMERLTLESASALNARHVLSFIEVEGLESPDCVGLGSTTWWRFFPARWMLSENEQQNSARKKQVWTLLQKFKSELGG